MRVIRFTGYPIKYFSSLERFVAQQGKILFEKGDSLETVYDGISNEDAKNMVTQNSVKGTLHFNFPDLATQKRWIEVIAYFFHALRLIRCGGFDIVHVYFDPTARILNNLAFFFPNTIFIRTIGTKPDSHSNIKTLFSLKKWYWRFNLRNIDKVFCVSSPVRNRLNDYGVNPSKMTIIHNGVDTDLFHPGDTKHNRVTNINLIFAGRLSEVKQIHLLINGMQVLVHEKRIKDVKFLVVGQGSLRSNLERLVTDLKLERYISFEGECSEIDKLLKERADVYVSASRIEGLPRAVLEAMAAGLPVVISDILEHQEIVVDGINGFLFSPGDIYRYVQNIIKLRSSPELRKLIGNNNRKKVLSHFSVTDQIYKEYTEYKRILREK